MSKQKLAFKPQDGGQGPAVNVVCDIQHASSSQKEKFRFLQSRQGTIHTVQLTLSCFLSLPFLPVLGLWDTW